MSGERVDAVVLYEQADILDHEAKIWAEIACERLLDPARGGVAAAEATARDEWRPRRDQADDLFRRAREAREAAAGVDS